jgi:hypothetical protein
MVKSITLYLASPSVLHYFFVLANVNSRDIPLVTDMRVITNVCFVNIFNANLTYIIQKLPKKLTKM